jgi:CheY-like chemotaxis protein
MTMSRRRVLIVDDDAPFLELLQLCFAKANFDVILASNGEEALKILLESEPPDLVLSDFMMPEVNGIELCQGKVEMSYSQQSRNVLFTR